jgi:hypothetical protein
MLLFLLVKPNNGDKKTSIKAKYCEKCGKFIETTVLNYNFCQTCKGELIEKELPPNYSFERKQWKEETRKEIYEPTKLLDPFAGISFLISLCFGVLLLAKIGLTLDGLLNSIFEFILIQNSSRIHLDYSILSHYFVLGLIVGIYAFMIVLVIYPEGSSITEWKGYGGIVIIAIIIMTPFEMEALRESMLYRGLERNYVSNVLNNVQLVNLVVFIFGVFYAIKIYTKNLLNFVETAILN